MAELIIGSNFYQKTYSTKCGIYRTPHELHSLIKLHFTYDQIKQIGPELYVPYNYQDPSDVIFHEILYYQKCSNKNLETKALHYVFSLRMDRWFQKAINYAKAAEVDMVFLKLCHEFNHLLYGNYLPGHQKIFFYSYHGLWMRIDIVANPVNMNSLEVCNIKEGYQMLVNLFDKVMTGRDIKVIL